MKKNRNRKLSRAIRRKLPTIVSAIKAAEESDASSGSEKLDWAVDYLNGKIDIPLIPEWLEEQIFKVAISVIVELAKWAFGDEDWFQTLMKFVGLAE